MESRRNTQRKVKTAPDGPWLTGLPLSVIKVGGTATIPPFPPVDQLFWYHPIDDVTTTTGRHPRTIA